MRGRRPRDGDGLHSGARRLLPRLLGGRGQVEAALHGDTEPLDTHR
jgi:hypothetical protein